MGSHSVTCHPTQVNTPRLNPSQTGQYSIDLPWKDGRLATYSGNMLSHNLELTAKWTCAQDH